jgi:hypothetical protein
MLLGFTLFVTALAASAAASPPSLPWRPRAPGTALSEPELSGHDNCCTICGGIAVYPTAPGTVFFSTMTVPGLPLNTSAWEVATYYIYCELTCGETLQNFARLTISPPRNHSHLCR